MRTIQVGGGWVRATMYTERFFVHGSGAEARDTYQDAENLKLSRPECRWYLRPRMAQGVVIIRYDKNVRSLSSRSGRRWLCRKKWNGLALRYNALPGTAATSIRP